jgi:outer membrane biosynthesis protein TonB
MSKPANPVVKEVESTVAEVPQKPTKAKAKPKVKRGRKPKKEVPAPSEDEKNSEAEETREREPWKDSEIDILKIMYHDRVTMSNMAKAIRRSDSTVRSKIKSLIEKGELAERNENDTR